MTSARHSFSFSGGAATSPTPPLLLHPPRDGVGPRSARQSSSPAPALTSPRLRLSDAERDGDGHPRARDGNGTDGRGTATATAPRARDGRPAGRWAPPASAARA
ncbi:hypothetical protein PR202_ga10139 [Eleusine coracana subsp. coracana]|uniref:Uncharacterized protein n=1 Tax=Eleusine coracana subsp. coracana TaxID=191504 RepID=A0AAV5C5Z5_ELECO|nr:hypothetical protein PR202_ga10139 [Eleusine coracana subsp. coracana]